MKDGVAVGAADELLEAVAPNENVAVLVGNEPNVGAPVSLAPKVGVDTLSPDPNAGVAAPKAGNDGADEDGACPNGLGTEALVLGCPKDAKGAAGVVELVVELPPKLDTVGAG